MLRKLAMLLVLVTSLAAPPAFAGQRIVKLAVANMYCAACPYIVKQSLARVPGVSEVTISFEEKTATEDQKTSPGALIAASTEAGSPSCSLDPRIGHHLRPLRACCS